MFQLKIWICDNDAETLFSTVTCFELVCCPKNAYLYTSDKLPTHVHSNHCELHYPVGYFFKNVCYTTQLSTLIIIIIEVILCDVLQIICKCKQPPTAHLQTRHGGRSQSTPIITTNHVTPEIYTREYLNACKRYIFKGKCYLLVVTMDSSALLHVVIFVLKQFHPRWYSSAPASRK